jgi:peroxiredoxin family protein
MGEEKQGLGIIFHSGSYDRIYQGMEIALTALALERKVQLFFSYWALEYLRRDADMMKKIENEPEYRQQIVIDGMKNGGIKDFAELFSMLKQLGGKLYTCPGSMALLNITQEELIDEVDESMGLPLFLMKTENDQLLFV